LRGPLSMQAASIAKAAERMMARAIDCLVMAASP
jgi:hypothetical protein